MAIRVPLPAHDAENGANGQERADGVAFEDLWQHRSALRDICQRIVGDAATADDVVQETYVRALNNLDRLEQRPSLMPWLATVARRRSIDELRRRQYQRPVDAMPDESTKPELDPGEAAGVSETVSKVRDALTALTDRERELLMRQVNQGLSLAELAAYDNSSVASVRSVLSRARSKLRDALEDAGARLLAPVGVLVHATRRRLGAVSARMQQVSPMVPGGYERVGEAVSATAAMAAIALGGILPAAGGAPALAASNGTAVDAMLIGSESGLPAADDGAGQRVLATPTATSAALHRGAGSADDAGAGNTGASAGETGSQGPVPGAPDAPLPDGPGVPDNPLEEPEPENPEETDVSSVEHSSGHDGEPGTIFAIGTTNCATGSCHDVWESTDGGATWDKRRGDGLEGDTLLVPPQYGHGDNRIFATGPGGLQYSLDGGDTWEYVTGVSLSGPPAMSPGFEPGVDERIYFGGSPTWSYDAGTGIATPAPVAGLIGDVTHFAPTPDFAVTNEVFAGGVRVVDGVGQFVVARCTSSCEEDDVVVFADVDNVPEVAVSSTFNDDGIVTAWEGRDLYASFDAGASFDAVDLPAVGPIGEVTDDGAGNFYVRATSAASAASALWRTRDFQTWTPLGAGTPLAQGVRTISAVTDDLLVAAPVGIVGRGMYCSIDDGATWSRRCA